MRTIYILLEHLNVQSRKYPECQYKVCIYRTYDQAIYAFHCGINKIIESGFTINKIEHTTCDDIQMIRMVSNENWSEYQDGSLHCLVKMGYMLIPFKVNDTDKYISYTYKVCDWNFYNRLTSYDDIKKSTFYIEAYQEKKKEYFSLKKRSDEYYQCVSSTGHVQVACIVKKI